MNLIYKEILGVEYVSCNLIINIGYKNNISLSKNDVHLIEHLIFHGHPNYSQGEIFDYFEENGGIFNAQVFWDYTTIYFRIHETKLTESLSLLITCIKNFNIEEIDYTTEKKIISVEDSQLEQNFEYIATNNVLNKFYPNIPDNYFSDYNNILKTYNDFYSIDRWKIIIVGDLNIKTLNKLKNKYEIEKNFKSKPNFFSDSKEFLSSKEHFKDENYYFSYLKLLGSDDLGARLFQNLIFEGYSSCIYQKLVESEAICYSINSTIIKTYEGNILIVFSQYVGNENLIKEFFNMNFEKLIEDFSPKDLEKVKEKTLSNLYIKKENIGLYSHLLVNNYAVSNNILSYDDMISKLKQMSTIDIKNSIKNAIKRK